MMPLSTWLFFLAIFVGIYIVRSRAQSRRSPPGPPKLPIIGNLHQAPLDLPWLQFQKWTKQYGPIYKLQFGFQTIMILGGYAPSRDLLDKKSNIYSSRPRIPMAGECVTKGKYSFLLPYGPKLRTHQRIQGAFLNRRVAETYLPVHDFEAKQMLFDFLSSPDYHHHFHRHVSSTVFTLAYGKPLPRGDEPEEKEIAKIAEAFVIAARVGTWIVDAIPALNSLPNFLAPWKRYGDELFNFEKNVHMGNMAKAEKAPGWNWSKFILSRPAEGFTRVELAYDVGMNFAAASETSVNSLEWFVLTAVLFPTAMARAREELDRVVGSDRLPDFSDRDSLPYVQALILEVLRWRPVVAGGIPHAVTEDDEYMGYSIPAGATVIAPHWALAQDESIYPSPNTFRPERYLENPDLPICGFGYGRRACPGQQIAKNTLFIIVARLLWVFDIEFVGDRPDDMKMTQGFTTKPVQFPARFTPREGREAVVRREWEAAEKDVGVYLEEIGRKVEKTRLE